MPNVTKRVRMSWLNSKLMDRCATSRDDTLKVCSRSTMMQGSEAGQDPRVVGRVAAQCYTHLRACCTDMHQISHAKLHVTEIYHGRPKILSCVCV